MIKGTLLLSLPIIKHFGRKFSKSENAYFLLSFWTPWKNPWTDMSETYGHVLPSQALRPAIYGAKQRLAVFTEIRLINKKKEKTPAIQNSLPYRHTPERAAVIIS